MSGPDSSDLCRFSKKIIREEDRSGAARAAMPEIGAPSTPAQRQGGAANCKETPPPDHLFSSHDEGSRHGVDFQGLQFSDYRLTDELPTVYDRLGSISRLASKKPKSGCVSAEK